MVDKVTLNPMQFSKRGGGLSVPQTQQIPSLRNLPAVRDVGTESQAQALMSLADDGTRLANLSGEQFERHITEVEADQAIEAEKVYSRSLNLISEGIDNIRNSEGDISNIPDATLDFYNATSSEIISQSDGLSQYQKDLLKKKYDNNRLNVTNQALGYQAKLRNIERESAVSEIISNTSSYIYRNPGQLESRLSEIKDTLIQSGINPTQAEAELLKQRSAFASSAIQGMVAQDPAYALNQIKSGRYDEYLDGPTIDRLSRFAESNIKKQEAIRTSDELKDIAEFEVKIKNDPLSVTDQDISEAREIFGFSEAETLRMFKLRADAEFENGVTEKDNERIMDSIRGAGDRPLNQYDDKDQKAAGNFYNNYIAPKVSGYLEQGDMANASNIISDYVGSVGVAPKELMTELLGRVRNGSPEQRQFAVDALGKIKLKAPNVDTGINAKDMATVDVIRSISKFEPDPEKAIEKADTFMMMDEGMRDGRITAARKELENINGSELVLEEFEPSFLSSLIGVGGPSPTIDTRSGAAYRINKTFQEAYESYFVHNPDPDKAKDYAIEQTAKRSGVTSITGKPKLMQYAPEKIMPPLLGGMDYIEIDFKETVGSMVPENHEVELVETEITSRTATPEAISRRGRGPIYGVIAYDENGLPYALKDSDGDNVVYELPLPNKTMEEKVRNALKEGFVSARELATLPQEQRKIRQKQQGMDKSIEQLKGFFE